MSADPRGYWFRSHLFSAEPGVDQETNPGRYGRQVARWLAVRLRERGYVVEPVVSEDWGWCFGCRSGADRFLVACGNVDFDPRNVAPELPAPTVITWHCFPTAASPIWRRLLRRHEVALALQRFDGELHEILETEAGIVLTDEP
jgi:hypothetical protein